MRQIMNFGVMDYAKFIDVVSDSTWQLTFTKQHLSSFRGESKENIHNHLEGYEILYLSELHICVSLEFLHILQPKQHIAIG